MYKIIVIIFGGAKKELYWFIHQVNTQITWH